jgi:hypothetical protein
LMQIWSSQRPVVNCISKQIDFFQLVLVLGWVYLVTQAGHHSTRACLTES